MIRSAEHLLWDAHLASARARAEADVMLAALADLAGTLRGRRRPIRQRSVTLGAAARAYEAACVYVASASTNPRRAVPSDGHDTLPSA